MKVAIHQPNYIPWPGYFYKISISDAFVFLDDVQYTAGGADAVINRNKVKTANGVIALTVPVKKQSLSTLITETQIDYNQPWVAKHLKTLQHSYSKAPYFKDFFPVFEDILNTRFDNLADLNMRFILEVCRYIGLSPAFYRSSQIDYDRTLAKDDLLLALLQHTGADTYISGRGGLKYMELDRYAAQDIAVEISAFTPQPYPQLFGTFEPGLSMLDMLFNCGPEAASLFEVTV